MGPLQGRRAQQSLDGDSEEAIGGEVQIKTQKIRGRGGQNVESHKARSLESGVWKKNVKKVGSEDHRVPDIFDTKSGGGNVQGAIAVFVCVEPGLRG